ncbi:hypothetical protein Psed_6194 [Pseudonocardia dioxanivorans CB1190]|uniref:Antibiotic biosynthesis monooxygenase n=1 Tax=Pseudonocardia dioxanivorans (strain ATCC 55486 / DSM 44775 / JCM 13855 / CB1190) TaxID=675635 RepID=F4CNJ7_PSEUX|nr:hypothetical protein [Pseudonocardia dioxanivorans]AEA28295.1 hypothetical protein Psed_6194 [Pseudonocardia dioxanivorans CB1190]GJF02867.1 hypothetical protein PSD17_18290 [Pseudonocardia sp. D17]
MVYAFVQDVPINEELYRRIVEELGPEPMEGSLLHLCVRRPDGGLRYIDVWTDEQACARAFDERIHPAVDRAFGGSRPGAEPTVDRLEVIDASGALLPL